MAISPVHAQDYPIPPQNPDEPWWPPYGGELMEPVVDVEAYNQTEGNPVIPQPSTIAPGTSSSLVNAYLVNSQGQVLTNLYRNQVCYLIVSVNGPGYFYLWEYYPHGTVPYGHWLSYRWHCGQAGTLKLGPFTAEAFDPAGRYTWKTWFLSGLSWSSRSLSFNYTGRYYPPDIPGLPPKPTYAPEINSFSADKYSVNAGEPVILTWSTTNARSVQITPDIGTVAGSGSTSVTPVSTTTYKLLAKGKSGDSVSSTKTITVLPRIQPDISIGQSTIQRGQTTSLSWNAPGAVKVSITDVGEVGISGSTQVSPDKTTTYTLSAAYFDGTTQSASVTVNIKLLPYWLWGAIAFLVIAAIVIAFLLIRRRATSQREQTEAVAMESVQTEQSGETNSTDTAPVTTPLVDTSSAKLIMPNGDEIFLAGNARSFGRHDFEGSIPDDQLNYLSRQHINIWYEDNQYYIEDRSSTNGTRVNGIGIKGTGRHVLSEGDFIELASKASIFFKENKEKEGE
jgi:hypothetical protein